MIDNLTFVNISRIWPIVIIAFCLWLVFAWKEKVHYKTSKFFINLMVSLIAISSLVCIALQPQTQVKMDKQLAVVLTEGFKQTQLDSLKKANKNLDIYHYKIGETLFKTNATPSFLFILGHGIQSFDQWQLETIPSLYLGGKTLKGITQLHYDFNQTKGNRIQFKGVYNNPTRNNSLVLVGPGGSTLDSITLTNKNPQTFKVSTDVNVIGNFNYHLLEKDSLGKMLSKAILPLSVVEKKPLKILMLNEFPTFESKYLKNYLAETGHQVVVKNKLTKARYKYEYFNIPNRPIINITQEKLELFDVLIIDTKTLNAFSKQQLNTLEIVVRDLGLGILIQPDANYFRNKKRMAAFQFEYEKNKTTVLNDHPNQKIKKYLYQFKPDFSTQAIHKKDSKIWSAYQRLGSGRIGSTVFQNTFELILNGQSKTYHKLWSQIIEKISKPKTPSLLCNANSNLAYINQPFQFHLRTNLPNPMVSSSEGFTIPLQRDFNIKNLWSGTVYPKTVGWKQHTFNQDSTIVFQYFVTDTLQWKSVHNFNTVNKNTMLYNTTSQAKTTPRTHLKLVNPLWFFLLFMLCIGYLWLEPKL